ncbi:MAG: efflux RND transporter periplasmic adaptor subunit [Candidatus Eremiobacteraeota bacterium]|nr:efflux RND transporter periplasmic adaptor subunit [Candidatus Eremiobacteraeota bacterium]
MKPPAAWTAILIALSLTACAHHGPPGGGGPMGGGNFAMPVAAAPITRGQIASTFSVTSTVVPLLQASLSSVISGNVLSVTHQIGEHVSKGELLVKIDDSTLRAQLAQAQAHLANLQATYYGGTKSASANLQSAKVTMQTDAANYRRDLELYSQGFVSKQQLDQARSTAQASQAAYQSAEVANTNASVTSDTSAASADLKNAQAAVQQIAAQIALTNVTAPFDGIVTQRSVDPGTLASPGTALVQVSQLDPVYVDAGISGDDLQYVKVGTPVTVTVNNIPGRQWHASVAYLNLASNPGSLTYQARVRVANPDLTLRGGMVATVDIVRSHKNNVLIAPRAAVYQTDAGYSMFIIQDGKAAAVPIELGVSNDQVAEVSGTGLKPGVMAILNHSVLLQPGTPVQVLPAGGGPPQAKSGGKNGAG